MGGIAGLTMGAAAAVLPAAGAAVGIGTSMALGLSGAAATTITTAATVAGGAAIAAVGAFTVSSIIEQGTSSYFRQIPCPIGPSSYSYNPIRDSVLGGNQRLYDDLYMASGIVTAGIIHVGSANIGLKQSKPTPPRENVTKRIDDIQTRMTDGEKAKTTYGVAEVKLKDGTRETWEASAGKEGYVRPDIRGNDIVIQNKVSDATPLNRYNDVEQTLIREANSRNAEILSMGATRPVCPACQTVIISNDLTDRVVTPFK